MSIDMPRRAMSDKDVFDYLDSLRPMLAKAISDHGRPRGGVPPALAGTALLVFAIKSFQVHIEVKDMSKKLGELIQDYTEGNQDVMMSKVMDIASNVAAGFSSTG